MFIDGDEKESVLKLGRFTDSLSDERPRIQNRLFSLPTLIN